MNEPTTPRESLDACCEPQANCSSSSSSLDPLETSTPNLGDVISRSQLRLHAGHHEHRRRLIAALSESDDVTLQRRARRLDSCCQSPLIHVDEAGAPRLQLQMCRDRLCPLCQRDRGRDLTFRVLAAVKSMDAPRFATFTLRHREASLKSEVERLAAAFKKLRKIERWKECVLGGVWVIEVTRNARTGRWHVHLHTILEGTFYAQKALSADWLAATGDSDVVDIRAVHSQQSVAKYLAAYVAKSAAMERWHGDQVREYAAALHGRRLIGTFGAQHGFRLSPKSDERPKCTWTYVCSARRLRERAEEGNERWSRALCVLARQSSLWSMSLGYERLLDDNVTPSAEEVADAIAFLRDEESPQFEMDAAAAVERPPKKVLALTGSLYGDRGPSNYECGR